MQLIVMAMFFTYDMFTTWSDQRHHAYFIIVQPDHTQFTAIIIMSVEHALCINFYNNRFFKMSMKYVGNSVSCLATSSQIKKEVLFSIAKALCFRLCFLRRVLWR